MKNHSCSTCKEALVSNKLDDDRKLLCYFKAYEQGESTFGGLNVPTNCYLQHIQLEDIFMNTSPFSPRAPVLETIS